MNKKLAIAILLPSLSACAGHSVKDSVMARKPASTHQGKLSAQQVKVALKKHQAAKATFETYSTDPDAINPTTNNAPSLTHSLQVFVSDQNGYAIVSGPVQIKDAQGNAVGSQTQDANGDAGFKLTPGTYSAHVEGGSLAAPLDETFTLVGNGAHSILTLQGDEKGNGSNGPKDGTDSSGATVITIGNDKVLKTSTIDVSKLPSNKTAFSVGPWTHLGEMCKWQRMPWDGNNTKKLSFGAAVLSPFYVTELSVGCNVYQGVLTPKVKFITTYTEGQHSYQSSNGSNPPDDSYRVSPDLQTNTLGNHSNKSVYSFNVVAGATQSVVLKAPTDSFYFSAAPADTSNPQFNAFDEDLVGHTTIAGTDYSFVSYQIKEYWVVTTLNDGTAGPVKDGTASVEKLLFLVSGKSGYPIVMKDEFSSTVDPDTFEVAVRATKIASQDSSYAQDHLSAYVKAYAQAEAASAGPEDALFSWNYYRVGTQTQANITKLMGDDAQDVTSGALLNSGAQWMDQMGLSLAYTKSPTNNPFSWKNVLDQTHGTSLKITTYAPRWGSPSRSDIQSFAKITPNFMGALDELANPTLAATLGSGTISSSEVDTLIQEAKKNISQASP